MFTKEHILSEIARTAKENGGAPLGVARFYGETGVKETDWRGKYWARWGDALNEVGLKPNTLRAAYKEEFLLEKLAVLAKELHRFPTGTEIQLKARADKTFPHLKPFKRLGHKTELATKLLDFCEGREEYQEVREFCLPLIDKTEPKSTNEGTDVVLGYVYLLKAGRYYKIGKSNAVGRRERELAIQLPERSKVVHSIKTDDPAGIEDYWHRRFDGKRKNGEWFELTAEDLAVFKRRKFM